MAMYKFYKTIIKIFCNFVILNFFVTLCVLLYSDQPDVLYQPVNSTVVQNGSVTILCGINIADPMVVVEYSWQLNNSRLNLSSPRYMLDAGNITISNAQAEDGGIYECLATLSVRDNRANYLLFTIGRGIISVVCKYTVYLLVTFLKYQLPYSRKIWRIWRIIRDLPN